MLLNRQHFRRKWFMVKGFWLFFSELIMRLHAEEVHKMYDTIIGI